MKRVSSRRFKGAKEEQIVGRLLDDVEVNSGPDCPELALFKSARENYSPSASTSCINNDIEVDQNNMLLSTGARLGLPIFEHRYIKIESEGPIVKESKIIQEEITSKSTSSINETLECKRDINENDCLLSKDKDAEKSIIVCSSLDLMEKNDEAVLHYPDEHLYHESNNKLIVKHFNSDLKESQAAPTNIQHLTSQMCSKQQNLKEKSILRTTQQIFQNGKRHSNSYTRNSPSRMKMLKAARSHLKRIRTKKVVQTGDENAYDTSDNVVATVESQPQRLLFHLEHEVLHEGKIKISSSVDTQIHNENHFSKTARSKDIDISGILTEPNRTVLNKNDDTIELVRFHESEAIEVYPKDSSSKYSSLNELILNGSNDYDKCKSFPTNEISERDFDRHEDERSQSSKYSNRFTAWLFDFAISEEDGNLHSLFNVMLEIFNRTIPLSCFHANTQLTKYSVKLDSMDGQDKYLSKETSRKSSSYFDDKSSCNKTEERDDFTKLRSYKTDIREKETGFHLVTGSTHSGRIEMKKSIDIQRLDIKQDDSASGCSRAKSIENVEETLAATSQQFPRLYQKCHQVQAKIEGDWTKNESPGNFKSISMIWDHIQKIRNKVLIAKRFYVSNDQGNVWVQYNKFGSSSVIHVEVSIDRPKIKLADDVLIMVEASTITTFDTDIRFGVTQSFPRLPIIPGCDCIGRVIRCGHEATSVYNIQVNDRVVCVNLALGGNTRYLIVRASSVIKLPDDLNVNAVEAVCLIQSFSTAYQCLHRVGHRKLKRGDVVVIFGGDSPVGFAAIQLAIIYGADVYTTYEKESGDYFRTLGIKGFHSVQECAGNLHRKAHIAIDLLHDFQVDIVRSVLKESGQLIYMASSHSKLNQGSDACNIENVLSNIYAMFAFDNRDASYSKAYAYNFFEAISDIEAYKTDLFHLFNLLSSKRILPRISLVVPLDGVSTVHSLLEKQRFEGECICLPWVVEKKNDTRKNKVSKRHFFSKDYERAHDNSELFDIDHFPCSYFDQPFSESSSY